MKALVAIALSFVTFCGLAEDTSKAEEKKPDPVVGRWRWSVNNYLIDILSDGTMKGPREVGTGVWKAMPTTTVERKYQLTWRGGEGVDTIILSPDGRKLSGKALDGFKFTAARGELGAGADAQNTAEKKVDPVVGRWNPTNTKIPISLNADGSASDRDRTGKWECLTPNVTPRKYRITWENGISVDTLSLLKDGKELAGKNAEGHELRWIRLPPP